MKWRVYYSIKQNFYVEFEAESEEAARDKFDSDTDIFDQVYDGTPEDDNTQEITDIEEIKEV